ncbi:hypothetical protein [Marinobacter sp. BGYM27]|uniref:hypothetical protein n=1 Tax=Marinobacter sp. BGYM27 TaxID=2975597 RepID=UPI0021A7D26F|nr:hypothetical protein [Marinobacter sp. BGYM27]MDG5501505.1 hypothetical protein [Marinobacter sp. BGYM27]
MMKPMRIWLATAALVMASGIAQADAPLTDERVDKFLDSMTELQPVMEQVGQRLASLPEDEQPPKLDPKSADYDPEEMADGMSDALKKVDAYSDVRRVAEDSGFDSVEELLEVQARVMMGFMAATQEAMMENPNVPEEARKQMAAQFGGIADKVSDNDKAVLKRNQKKIMEFMQAQQQNSPQ